MRFTPAAETGSKHLQWQQLCCLQADGSSYALLVAVVWHHFQVPLENGRQGHRLLHEQLAQLPPGFQQQVLHCYQQHALRVDEDWKAEQLHAQLVQGLLWRWKTEAAVSDLL